MPTSKSHRHSYVSQMRPSFGPAGAQKTCCPDIGCRTWRTAQQSRERLCCWLKCVTLKHAQWHLARSLAFSALCSCVHGRLDGVAAGQRALLPSTSITSPVSVHLIYPPKFKLQTPPPGPFSFPTPRFPSSPFHLHPTVRPLCAVVAAALSCKGKLSTWPS